MVGKHIGPYRIELELARGGNAVVYRAVRDGGAAFALKFVPREAPDYEARCERLRNEAEQSARLDHPRVARTLSCDECEQGFYSVQVLLHGRPLHHVWREETRPGAGWPAARAAKLGAQIAEALAHMHARGVVHGDLKPPNVMLCEDGAVVCDLGLAVLAGSPRPHDVLMGSPSYMAPEATRGEALTPQADLWSLGVVLFEALHGARPFGLRDDPPEAILRAVRSAPLPKLPAHQPEPLRLLVEGLLLRSPELRTGGADEVAARLNAMNFDSRG